MKAPTHQGPMRLAELVYGPWAIERTALAQLQSIYETHLRGEKIDIAALETKLGRPLANEQASYDLVSGVAVLPIQGVMAPKANLMMRISGGASTQMLADEISAAAADHAVRSILLVIDSPGGSVLGTPELGQAIRQAAGGKPVVALCDGVMASAAYWAGSAANAVYITGPTVMVGNIGVVATHTDTSVADAKSGVKKTEITAGKYKRIASSLEPLTPAGKASLQEQVDYLYSLFVEVVAENRGVDVAIVLQHMADGRVFIGQQAIDAGLVDGVSTLDGLIAQMASNPAAFSARRKAKLPGERAAPASGSRTVPKTKAEQAAEAKAFAAANGIGFAAAFKQLGFDEAKQSVAAAIGGSPSDKHDQADAAQRHAKSHGISFVDAFKQLGFDGPTSRRAAGAPTAKQQQLVLAQRYARQHGVELVAALKKLGPAS